MTDAEELELRRTVTAALRAKFTGDARVVDELLAPHDPTAVAAMALSLAGTLAMLASDGRPVELLDRLALVQAEESG